MFSGIPIAQQAPARRWSALTSFTLQAALVAAAWAYPLFHPESLPPREHPLLLPVSTTEATRAAENAPASRGSSRLISPMVVVSSHPIFFDRAAARAEETGTLTAPDIHALGTENPGDVLGPIVRDTFLPMPRPAPPVPPRVSAVMEGNLIYRVAPQYPSIAKQLHVEGTVVVKAFISREGTIESAQVERGQALLAHAALEAVRQWRYRPYYLNHVAVEVETEITVNFVLER